MQQEAFVLDTQQLMHWIDSLRADFRIVGPTDDRGSASFHEIRSTADILLDYGLTMMGPQIWLFHLDERFCTFKRSNQGYQVETPESAVPQVLLGVHSCDLHAILILDKVFVRKPIQDHAYREWRKKTVLIGYHCTRICPQCFCASMGTGPHFDRAEGYDLLITDLGGRLLVQTLGDRGLQLLAPLKPRRAGPELFEEKERIKRRLLSSFQKEFNTTNIPEIVLAHQDHPVWQDTAQSRCLNCTNCTMVCPTCFCYNTKDRISFDGLTCDRGRWKDSCQELHFAQVHDANFRNTRTARLRQFVTHKLATWWEQFGFWGCIGCGRCMTWCPTKIDLTEMATEIRQTTTGMVADSS